MIRLAASLLCAALLLGGCEREKRSFRAEPPIEESQEKIALTSLSPGELPPERQVSGRGKDFENNASHVANGKTLFGQFNCSGCHANGGGGSGPALMDDVWIYGSDIENIVATIREGRPNGMPSFRGKIADEQIWELASYVRALGGFVSKDVASSRNDGMEAHPSENRLSAPTGPVEANPAPPAATQP
jgi:cytochrome c oxidase cbb3-type subunit 3